MALLSCQNLSVAFGGRPLLDGATLQVESGERVGLVGRNGEGKSTLLKIIARALEPDSGEVIRESGLRVSLLDQQVPADLTGSVREVVSAGLRSSTGHDHEVDRLTSLLALDTAARFESLSGGQKRRTLLGKALAAEPDLLLLDEPTNHLDLDGIEWLEGFLLRQTMSLLFVTHDRAFLQRLATRIVELDRGRLTSWACDYPTYLRRKEALLDSEEREWAEFDRVLAQEEVWIRQGIKARRTRNEGRVRALERMRRERADRRERIGTVRLTLQQTERTGSKVIEAKGVTFAWGDGAAVVRDLSVDVLRGDRIGVIGPNGAGKTTLLQLLLGRLTPDFGTVKHGTTIDVAYFDQHREQLDESASVADTVGLGSDHVTVNGERRHIMGYLQDFLFTPERARQPVRSLSGGERSRLLLARLFTRPANVLVLDEPTNDLDAETLELLEAALMDFDGTVLVVSHDRSFLDNLCSSCLVFEEPGVVKEYVGGYSDWKRTVEGRISQEPSGRRSGKGGAAAKSTGARARGDGPAESDSQSARPRKLSYAERREYDALPDRIERLEAELAEVHATLADPDLYRGPREVIREVRERAETLEADVDATLTRWAQLGEITG